jgi:hypothetical protein
MVLYLVRPHSPPSYMLLNHIRPSTIIYVLVRYVCVGAGVVHVQQGAVIFFLFDNIFRKILFWRAPSLKSASKYGMGGEFLVFYIHFISKPILETLTFTLTLKTMRR